MATFRKRNGKWNVQIRKNYGARSFSRTFTTKVEAKKWAAKTEAELDVNGRVFDVRSNDVLLGQLFTKYKDEVVPKHRGWKSELSVLKLVDTRLGGI